jgi:parallel beta-helix repeat protein
MQHPMHQAAMRSARNAVWLSALVLGAGAQVMSAANITDVVGTCKGGTHFSTIQAALDASPAPDTVEVCPGQYPEQLMITKPVTLEGIDQGNSGMVQIVLPSGYAINAAIGPFGAPTVAQVFVKDVRGGSVNLTNLAVNGDDQSVPEEGFLVGILYEESSGTINQVVTSGQTPTDYQGWGMWIQGGSSKSSVIVENSDMHDYNQGGLMVIGMTDTPNLTATIKDNVISNFSSVDTENLVLEVGTDVTVTGNFVSGGLFGIDIEGTEGAVTGNTVFQSSYGIYLGNDGVKVTSNNIYDTSSAGIDVQHTIHSSVVQNNKIKTVAPNGAGTGIELNCKNISPTLVNSNTLMDFYYGYGDAPAGFSGSNTYVRVNLDVSPCTGNGPSKASARYRQKVLGRSQEQ